MVLQALPVVKSYLHGVSKFMNTSVNNPVDKWKSRNEIEICYILHILFD